MNSDVLGAIGRLAQLQGKHENGSSNMSITSAGKLSSERMKPARGVRSFSVLVVMLAMGLFASAGEDATVVAPVRLSKQDLIVRRQELAGRKRRIILNNDANEPYMRSFIMRYPTPSREDFLQERTTGLAGSQVDAISYCTTAGGVGLFSHGTKVGSLRHLDNDGGRTLVRDYVEAGLDPLKVMAEFAHANKMEVFWSLRMNDTHDGAVRDSYGPLMFDENKFKREHPEYLLGIRPTNKERHLWSENVWSAYNYAIPEVREFVLRVIEEVCQNYDVDGVELDFFRHLAFFKSTVNGQKATGEEIGAMSDLIRRVRRLTEEEGMKRGRPFLMMVKVPDSVEYALAVGLDIDGWLKNGWIDMLVTTGYYRLNAWEYSVALGHKYGVPVYPSLDDARVGDEASTKLRQSALCFRGRAMEAWGAGADGVYLFNFVNVFRPEHPIWRELGDPGALNTMNKDYFANDRGVGGRYGLDHMPYRDANRISTLAPKTPIALQAGNGVRVPFPMADDFAAARLHGVAPRARLRARIHGLPDPSKASVSLAGTTLRLIERRGISISPKEDWLEFNVDPKLLVRGFNEAEIALTASVGGEVLLADLELLIRYESVSKMNSPADKP